MRKSVCLTIVAILLVATLASGAAAQRPAKSPKPVDFCSLFSRTLEDRTTGIVTTRAYLSYSTVGRVDGGDAFFYSPECGGRDFVAVSGDALARDAWKKRRAFFGKLAAERDYVFEVVITGRLETSIFATFGHLGWCRSEFRATNVRSIKDVTATIGERRSGAESPLTNLADSLREKNRNLVLQLIDAVFDAYQMSLLDDDFVAVDRGGNRYDAASFGEFCRRGVFASPQPSGGFSYENGSARKVGDVYEVRVRCKLETPRKETVDVVSTYRLNDGSWKLSKIELSKPKE